MALLDKSGTIVAGGTAQSLMLASNIRNGFSVQNNSAGDLWINELGSAAVLSQPSLKIVSGALYETPRCYPCPYAVSIIGATTAQAFTARDW